MRHDLRTDVRTTRATRLIVLCVDLSGSMGAPRRAAAATGTVLGLLDDAYQRRHRVALVAFRGDGADVVLAPTTSVDVARNRLHDLATGGATPLAAGLRRSLELVDRHADRPPAARRAHRRPGHRRTRRPRGRDGGRRHRSSAWRRRRRRRLRGRRRSASASPPRSPTRSAPSMLPLADGELTQALAAHQH